MRKQHVPDKVCPECGTSFGRDTCRQLSDFKEKIYCSRECYHAANSGSNHYNFKNGFRITPHGYLRDSNDNYVHRLVMENHIGRKLETWEHVHHKDENKLNNDISNLEILTNSDHRKEHSPTQTRNNNGKFARKETGIPYRN